MNLTTEAIMIVVALEVVNFIKGIFNKGFIEPLQSYLFKRLFNRNGLTFEAIESMVKNDCKEIDKQIKGYFGNAFNVVSDSIAHRDLSKEDQKVYKDLLEKTYSITKLLDY